MFELSLQPKYTLTVSFQNCQFPHQQYFEWCCWRGRASLSYFHLLVVVTLTYLVPVLRRDWPYDCRSDRRGGRYQFTSTCDRGMLRLTIYNTRTDVKS